MAKESMHWMDFDETKLYEHSLFSLQVISYPSFAVPEFYRITEREVGQLWLVMYDAERPIDFSVKERLLALLSKIDHAIPPKTALGIDGTSYELSIRNGGLNHLTFKWWEDQVGENWKPLITVREELIKLATTAASRQ